MATSSPLKTGNYLKKKDLFFDSSKLLFAQVTGIFDFIWPTVAGMWNLRWQVNGYLLAQPNSSVEELRGRFTKGSGIDGANLKRACQESTWDEQKEQFAVFLLVNSFAFYESWIVNTLHALGSYTKALENALQTRTVISASVPTGGIQFAINSLVSIPSIEMQDLFYGQYLGHSKNGKAVLDNLMICYRCFKELRNCIMHNGAIVGNRFINAYNDYSALNPAALNVVEAPVVDVPVLGESAKVNLRGVVGFYDIIMRLVATIDAELSVSTKALGIVISKSRTVNGRSVSLGSVVSRKNYQIRSLFHKIDMPTPLDYPKAEAFLRAHSLVA